MALTEPSGYVASITLPATSDGSSGSVTAAVTTTLPGGVVAPASVRRAPETIGAAVNPLLYVSVLSNAALTFNSTPAFSFVLPTGVAIPAGASAYIAFYDPTQSANGWLTVLGPATVTGRSVAFPATSDAVKIAAGTTYLFALVTTTQSVSLKPPGASTSFTVMPTTVPIAGLNTPVALLATEVVGTAAPVFPGPNVVFSPAACANSFNYNQVAATPPGNSTTLNVAQFQYLGTKNPATTPSAVPCALTLTDLTSKTSQTVTINALPFPLLLLSPTSVTMTGLGANLAQTVLAYNSDRSTSVLTNFAVGPSPAACTAGGPNFVAVPTSAPSTLPSPAPSGAAWFSVFQVNQISSPSCTLSVTSNQGSIVALTIVPASPPILTMNPSSVTLAGVGPGYGVTVTASESNGSAPNLKIGSSPWTVPTAAPSASPNPATACGAFSYSQTASTVTVFEVQPQIGTCALTVTDTYGNSAQVQVTLPSASNVSIGGQ